MVSWLGAKMARLMSSSLDGCNNEMVAAAEVAPLVAGKNRECDSNEHHGMNTHKLVFFGSSFNCVPRGALFSSLGCGSNLLHSYVVVLGFCLLQFAVA